MPELFETTNINGMKLRNRFVRSATWTGLAEEDGTCTERLTDLLTGLVRGGVGMIITGHSYVMKQGQAGPRQLAIDRDDVIPALRRLTNAVHDNGGRVVMQLAHAGIYGVSSLTGQAPLAVSADTAFITYPVQELTPEAVETVTSAFVVGALRALRAGFDGIQLHAGHGYLLNQLLSRAYNTRSDRYGGTVADRTEPLAAMIRRIRALVGASYPILVKLNSRDYLEHGLELDESLEIGRLLEHAGVDAIEISGGTRESGHLKSTRTGILTEQAEAYFEEAARAFRNYLGIPVIQVGGIRSHAIAERLLQSGAADYIAMSRPFICQPDLINRWRNGETHSSACRSDNECLVLGLNDGGIRCRWSSGTCQRIHHTR